MDPLSITASIIAVATLAAKTCATFRSIRDACDVLPGRLHAVSNEVVDFEAVCRQVVATLDQRAAANFDNHADSSIRELVQHAEETLGNLQVVLVPIAAASSNRSRLFAANAWKKSQSRLEHLQGELRAVKCSLNILLGASQSHDITRIRLELESVSTKTSESALDQTRLQNTLQNHHNSLYNSVTGIYQQVDQRISKMEDLLQDQANRLQEQQRSQLSLCGPPPAYRKTAAGRRSGQKNMKSLQTLKDGRVDAVGIRLTRYTSMCGAGCPCACHAQKKSTSPAIFERVLGRLFIDYAGLPMLNQKCNSLECARAQSARLGLEYWFPMSFVSQIMHFQLALEGSRPQVALNFLRRVPDTAQCVGFAQAGNIQGLQDLFKRGLASPRDVSSTRGYSLLRWALYAKQWDTCKFLVYQGADPDYRPIAANDNSPRNKACDFVLQGFLSKNAEESLMCLTSGTDWVEEQNFTVLHKIVTGISGADLEETLPHHLDEIDALDALGRTALHWAAARGDSRAVGLLLAEGADPNVLDIQATGAVSYAAERSHLVCVRLLLEAGALTDPPLPKGVFVGSALNCASRNCTDPMVMKTLLDFGADTEAGGIDKITSLHHATRTDNVSFAMLLLEYGADINASTATGQTPLTTAITMNSHNVLRLLLDRWYEYSACPRLQGPHLLRTAALFADLETIRILTATNHFKLKYDKSYLLADCFEQYADRFDVTEESMCAFRDLLDVLSEDPSAMKNVDSLLESGLLDHALRDASHLDSFSDAGSSHGSEMMFEDALENLHVSECPEKPLIEI